MSFHAFGFSLGKPCGFVYEAADDEQALILFWRWFFRDPFACATEVKIMQGNRLVCNVPYFVDFTDATPYEFMAATRP